MVKNTTKQVTDIQKWIVELAKHESHLKVVDKLDKSIHADEILNLAKMLKHTAMAALTTRNALLSSEMKEFSGALGKWSSEYHRIRLRKLAEEDASLESIAAMKRQEEERTARKATEEKLFATAKGTLVQRDADIASRSATSSKQSIVHSKTVNSQTAGRRRSSLRDSAFLVGEPDSAAAQHERRRSTATGSAPDKLRRRSTVANRQEEGRRGAVSSEVGFRSREERAAADARAIEELKQSISATQEKLRAKEVEAITNSKRITVLESQLKITLANMGDTEEESHGRLRPEVLAKRVAALTRDRMNLCNMINSITCGVFSQLTEAKKGLLGCK